MQVKNNLKRFITPRKTLYILTWIALIATVIGIIRLQNHESSSSTQKQTQQANNTTSGGSTGTGSGNASTQKSGSSATATTPTGNGRPATSLASGPCTAIFSLAEATQFLKSTATADGANGVTSQDADTTTTNCMYAAASANASVTAHIASSPLGASGNETVFGSARPSDATSVSGYGSAAFWQQSSGELNILDHNNWFIVHTSVGSLDSAKQLATVVHLAD